MPTYARENKRKTLGRGEGLKRNHKYKKISPVVATYRPDSLQGPYPAPEQGEMSSTNHTSLSDVSLAAHPVLEKVLAVLIGDDKGLDSNPIIVGRRSLPLLVNFLLLRAASCGLLAQWLPKSYRRSNTGTIRRGRVRGIKFASNSQKNTKATTQYHRSRIISIASWHPTVSQAPTTVPAKAAVHTSLVLGEGGGPGPPSGGKEGGSAVKASSSG